MNWNRGHSILLMICIVFGVWLLFLYSNPSIYQKQNEDLHLENDMLMSKIKGASTQIRALKDSVRAKDSLLLKNSSNAQKAAQIQYIKISAVDTLRNDSIYKFLKDRYVK